MRITTILAAGVGLAALSGGMASAQSQTPAVQDDPSALEDVIVTARKRSERLD